jgi:periplasmic protein CpxP/Spy
MTDTIQTPRRRFLKGAAIATAVAGIATAIGITSFAEGGGPHGWHRAGFMGRPIDPARLDEHVDRMLKHLYVEIDATETQKQQLAPIVQSAARDLLPLRTQLQDGRRQAVALLSQDTIDRGALEILRANQVQLAEQASKRFTQAIADVADVLTPAQRKQLAQRVGRWHGRRG